VDGYTKTENLWKTPKNAKIGAPQYILYQQVAVRTK